MGLKYYAKIDDSPLYALLRQSRIQTENQFMLFFDSIWQEFRDNGRSTGSYIVFYHGVKIDNCTHVPGPVDQYIADSEYNAVCTVWMDLAHFRMLNSEFLNKDIYVFLEQAPLIILDRKSAIFMDNNGKDTKHTRHISRIIHLVINGEKCSFHKTFLCERGLKLADIQTNNVREDGFNPRLGYAMVSLKIGITLVKEGW